MTFNLARASIAAALAVLLALSFAAVLPKASAATDGQLSVLINGQAPGDYCIAGPIIVSGNGVTGGQGSTWHLVVKWGDGTPDTTSDNTPSLITSGSVAAKNSAFTYSTSHNFTSGSTSGLTVILYHVQPSGQDGQVVVINQCVAAPTEGVVVLAKHVVNDNLVQVGTATASDFTLSIGSEDFEGSEAGAAPGAVLEAGSYAITEEGPDGYTRTGTSCVDTSNNSVVSTDGSINVVAGKNYKCTITNNDAAPVYGTLEIIKNVVNAGGGVKAASNFLISVFNEAEAKVAEAYGSVDGTEHSLLVGTYTIEENEDPHYSGEFSGACASGEVTLTEAGAECTITNTFHNTLPVANDDLYVTAEETVLSSGNVLNNDTDAEDDDLTAALVANADDGNVVLNADGSFTYTPDTDFVGEDSFTYQANDTWGNSNTATVVITVTPVNDAPVALDDAFDTAEDTQLSSGNVLDNDDDVDGDTLTVTDYDEASAQGGVVVVNIDGTFTYTPALDFNGEDSFTYTISDGNGGTDTATVVIMVGSENDTPEAVADTYEVDEDTELVITVPGVLGNDDDSDNDSLTAELGEGPTHGTLELNDDGSFTYTPNADFNGEDSFTYKACDEDTCSSTVTVTITVEPVNDAPVAEDDDLSTEQNVPVGGVLVATDVDAVDSLTFEIASSTSNGVLSFFNELTGAFTYTPNNNFVGEDFFTFFADDGDEVSNTATVTITVSESPENDLPLCSDGEDNDNDDKIDLADEDCADFIPELSLVKVVSGGQAVAADWTLTATADGSDTPALSGAGEVAGDVMPGTYTLAESGEEARYAASLWSCVKNDSEVPTEANTIVLAIGDEVTCTITNTFSPFSSDVSVVKSVDDTTPDNGQQISYTLTVTNSGPDEADNVVVTDVLPAGLSYVSDTSEGAYATSTGQWAVGDLANSESKSITIVVTVTAAQGETVTNTASATNDHADSDSADNTSSAPVTVNTPEDNGGGGGGGGGSRRAGSVRGEVLGESCGLYMNQYLKRALPNKNNPAQVTRLQEFLVKHGYGTFTPTGFFGPMTEAAVKAFQVKYAAQILTPWNLTAPTGLAYLTTIRQVNLIECPDLMIAMPELIPWSSNPNAQ